MKKFIGIFDPKKMTPEQIFKKVQEVLEKRKTPELPKGKTPHTSTP